MKIKSATFAISAPDLASCPPAGLPEQVTLLRVLDAIYRSAADGRDITL